MEALESIRQHPAMAHLPHEILNFKTWPNVDTYNNLFTDAPITFCPQDTKSVREAGGYEQYIRQQQKIPTRSHNIHDLMNAFSWQLYPQSKLCLHHTQSGAQNSDTGANDRSQQQNACTLFDECGAVVVSRHSIIEELSRNHDWKTLFWQHRTLLESEAKLYIFGHALFEKLAKPYIGMCAKALFLDIDHSATLTDIDQQLAEELKTLQQPKQLQPFPILGWPLWDSNNQQEHYYENSDYFRAKAK